ncbi:Epidermal growth factor receptor substrate 15 like [Dissostichus eleginoides]|uniref:Epidermal growth factor receptor substrate 15 like n=1 Tax=Dissostichus eleginoides TaxID=100907 RepID=A0AAD9FCE7_DISEL|nr:Epidermal growth factor receptor substrate 15 like [Dissostichus eleginoides]
MDRRSVQNNRGNPRPFNHAAEADQAYRQIHCRNGQIHGLNECRGAFEEERVRFFHSMHIEKDRVKRLEELLSYRDSGFHQEHKRQFDTIKQRGAEICHLNENMEAAESQHKQQLDQLVARYEAEKRELSDQSNQVTTDSQNNDGPLQFDAETI